VEREIIGEKFGKMIWEREIVGENFEKKKRKYVRNNKKKHGKKIFGRDSRRKKDVGRKFMKIAI
jgi:hypothetical protein